MEDVFDQDQDNALPAEDKETCQTLLLTISLKEKMFNENQRNTAKKLLQKLEGDRRRRCRTSNIGAGATAVDSGIVEPSIRKELLIVSSKKRKSKGKKKADDDSDSDDEKARTKKRSRKSGTEELDEDGFKKWSDDEGDWSDVDDGKLGVLFLAL